MSHFIDESGVSHYVFDVLKEDFGIFKSFMSTHPMTDYGNFEELVYAIRKCLYDKHCRTAIFPYTFDEWQLFYDKALIQELIRRNSNSNFYQYYTIGTLQADMVVLSKNSSIGNKKSDLPPQLATKQAMAYWGRAMDAGWVDSNYQPLITRQHAALLADYMGRKLKLEKRWKWFEELWHIDTMRKDFDKAMSASNSDMFIEQINHQMRD